MTQFSANGHVVGISLSHGGGASVIDQDRKIVAISEERLTGRKHTRGYLTALLHCLKESGSSLADSSAIVFVNDGQPLVQGYSGRLELLGASPLKCHSVNHHLAHACTAFFSSPYDRSSVLVIDGEGNTGETESFYLGHVNQLTPVVKNSSVGQSLGIGRTYEAFTNLLGWTYEEASNTMAIAAYGNHSRFRGGKLFSVSDDLKIESALSYSSMQNTDLLADLMELPILRANPMALKFAPCAAAHVLALEPGLDLRQLVSHGELAADLASYVQCELERVLVELVRRFLVVTGEKKLCMTGGVALNVAANRTILENTDVKTLYIPPASNDRGLPLGAALHGYYHVLGMRDRHEIMTDFLGPMHTEENFAAAIAAVRIRLRGMFDAIDVSKPESVAKDVAELLEEGKIVGRFVSRAEFGPRALGNRSILADPRSLMVATRLSATVKQRESFRPYAASILREDLPNCFDIDFDSPFMLFLAHVKSEWRPRIPAVLHVDNTCRVQTVDRQRTPDLSDIIEAFRGRTGIPMVLNTSFNERGCPIVESPYDAILCFLKTGLDALALGPFLLTKTGVMKG